jgi:hypothetical protein
MYDFNMRNYTLVHPMIRYFCKLDQQQKLPLNSKQLNLNDILLYFHESEHEIRRLFDKYYHFKHVGYFGEIKKKII